MTSTDGLVVGIDVSVAKGRPLPIVVARDDGNRVTPLPLEALPREPPRGPGNRALALGHAGSADDPAVRGATATTEFLAETAESVGAPITRIAIDAPGALAPAEGRRGCEQAMSEAGLSYYQTPADLETVRATARTAVEAGVPDHRLPEANRLWMVAGLELFRSLRARFGAEDVIEVYPFAAFDRLGAAARRKSSPEGRRDRLTALAAYGGWNSASAVGEALDRAVVGEVHDRIDAYLCTVLAARARERDCFVGDAEDPSDRIWMPPLPARSAAP